MKIIYIILGLFLIISIVSAADEKVLSGIVWNNTKGIIPINVNEKNSLSNVLITEAIATKISKDIKESNTVSIKYTNDKEEVGIVTMFCPDNMGYNMPVWGGMANGKNGEWKFALSDDKTLPKNIDKCYFAVIDGNKEAIK